MTSTQIRKPEKTRVVRRSEAERYVLYTLVALAGSVIVTRVYLEWTGYPQIGGGNLHIAHVLWGGLLLYIAALLPLMFVGGRVLTWSAFLNGVGAGLFIDEVGKFITANNDYFYPPAAPLIYAFFLLSVLVYLNLRRDKAATPQADLVRALAEFPELVQARLTAAQRAEILRNLQRAEQAANPASAQLATQLAHFVRQEHSAEPDSAQATIWQRMGLAVTQNGQRMGRRVHRRLIMLLLGWNGVQAFLGLVVLIVVVVASAQPLQFLRESVINDQQLRDISDWPWLLLHTLLQLAVGLIALLAFYYFVRGRDASGVKTAMLSLTISLTTVVLLTFYLNQFAAISTALMQFAFLLIINAYRNWYVDGANER
ncbi:MAG: hypothetical protein R3A44_10240 [Caldilineaceae bacterium]